MGRKPLKSPDEKLATVLSVLKGETIKVDAARRLGMSQTTIAKWQKQSLEGGRESLARGDYAVSLASRRAFGGEPFLRGLCCGLLRRARMGRLRQQIRWEP